MIAGKKIDAVFITAAIAVTAVFGFVCLKTPAGGELGGFLLDFSIGQTNDPAVIQYGGVSEKLYDLLLLGFGGTMPDSGRPDPGRPDFGHSGAGAGGGSPGGNPAATAPYSYPYPYAANDSGSLDAPYDGSQARAVMGGAESVEIPASAGERPIIPRDYSRQDMQNIKLHLNNETKLDVGLDEFLQRAYPIKADISDPGAPVVLILSTHATESYAPEGATGYSPAFSGARSSDPEESVLSVAKVLCETLNENGIPAIQSLTVHDEVSYQNSYARSLETMNAYIEKYPTIKYIFDVHRDSIIDEYGVKYKPTVTVDGENVAQIMFVVGSNAGGGNHPGWRDNLTFTTHLQSRLNQYYPSFARPVNLREVRFNQHTAPGAVILEAGSCGSALSEAKRAAKLLGEVLAELIKENAE